MSTKEAERYSMALDVVEEHIDELDHVSNLVYLQWVLDVARAHSDARGFDHAAYRALGGIFNVRRHEIDYLVPARLGDRIELTTWVDPWKRAWCVRRTEIARAEGGPLLARAATTWVFVDLQTRRPTRIPDALRTAF